MKTQEYIESGVLELYVLGAATDAEAKELLYFKEHYPEIQKALYELEIDMERAAQQMAIMPPPGTWEKIEDRIHELAKIPEYEPLKFKKDTNGNHNGSNSDNFIEVEAQSSQIRVHKNWKWVFGAVFVLSKVFLACAIYFYLENRQAQQQIQELKTELRTHKAPY